MVLGGGADSFERGNPEAALPGSLVPPQETPVGPDAGLSQTGLEALPALRRRGLSGDCFDRRRPTQGQLEWLDPRNDQQSRARERSGDKFRVGLDRSVFYTVKGYLTYKETSAPGTLPQACAQSPRGVSGDHF